MADEPVTPRGKLVALPQRAAEPAVRADDELMVAARSGERSAFDVLIRRHQRRVIGYAYKFFGNAALASDVAQDVFVDLLRALPRYRAEGHFSTFLYRITLNRCRMAARSRRYEDRAHAAFGDEEPGEGEMPPDREVIRAVQAATRSLSEKQREVLLLRFWSGLSHEEIAQVLELPIGTVKSRMFSAFQELRKVMNP